jgi:putative spermidine/putrescine transport system permease protein
VNRLAAMSFAALAGAAIFLIGPFLVIVLAALSAGETLAFPPQGMSLRWFRHVLNSDILVTSFRLSLVLAIAATFAAMLVGIPAAYGLSRYPLPGREAIRSVVTSPAIVPGLIVGLALLKYFVVPLDLPMLFALFAAHTALVVPYAVRVIGAGLSNLGVEVEEAAVTLGATRLQAFWRIVVPNVRSGMVAAFVLCFVTSFNQLPVSLFLAGPGVATLPVQMMVEMEHTYDPSIAALASLLAILSALIVFAAERLLGLSRHM